MIVRVAICLLTVTSYYASAAPFSLSSENAAGVSSGAPSRSRRVAPNVVFDGCFGGTEGDVVENSHHEIIDHNTNAICADRCTELGNAVAFTRNSTCYCADDYPLPVLQQPDNINATGVNGSCSYWCPGALSTNRSKSCKSEYCCGGPTAYSVYLVGESDVLKILVQRIMSNLVKDNYTLARELVKTAKNKNVALDKQAVMSSIYYEDRPARDANDGNINTFCHTSKDSNPWLIFDLGADYEVSYVVVENRRDYGLRRLRRFVVQALDFKGNMVYTWPEEAGGTDTPTYNMTLPASIKAVRYVQIWMNVPEYLHIAEFEVWGRRDNDANELVNLAVYKTAEQSSTLENTFLQPTAAKAIDGFLDGNVYRGSVTHTNVDELPWWKVDLGTTYEINGVVFWNRVDKFQERLLQKNVKISLYDEDERELPFNNNSDYRIDQRIVGARLFQVNFTKPQWARYVRVSQVIKQVLSLAEVQVIGSGPSLVNVAIAKPATQSSTILSADASRAVDGNMYSHFNGDSVTCTNKDIKAYWKVDLLVPTTVYKVNLWNRGDCCGSRLRYFNVLLLADDDTTVKEINENSNHDQLTFFYDFIPPAKSVRFVKIEQVNRQYLSLAEVQVVSDGKPAVEVRLAGQTATSKGEGAISECVIAADGNYSSFSCHDVNKTTVHFFAQEIAKKDEFNSPIQDTPLKTYDVIIDNKQGEEDQTLVKTYTVATFASSTWNVEAGVSVSVTYSSTATIKVRDVFEHSVNFGLTLGYSFTFGYSKTSSESETNSLQIRLLAPAGGNASATFLQQLTPRRVRWKATFATSGHVEVKFQEETVKNVDLARVLTEEQRSIYGFGVIDYGERPVVIARVSSYKPTDTKVDEHTIHQPGEMRGPASFETACLEDEQNDSGDE